MEVSVQDVRDICDRWPRLMPGMDDWPEQFVLLGDAEDSLFRSVEIPVGVGDEITLDPGMNLPCQ